MDARARTNTAMPSARDDLAHCLRFWSRLPIPAPTGPEPPVFGVMVRMLPVAGLVIAAPSCLVLVATRMLSLPPLVGAGLAIATLLATTGALHEDGLADVADGFWGGRDRERRLAIMRDSRIGAYGALALGVSLILRVAALAAIVDRSIPLALAALLAGAALSRTAGLLPLALLPPARADGAGAFAGAPGREPFRAAAIGAGFALVLPLLAGAGLDRTTLAALLAVAAAYSATLLARGKVGGQTGDVAGAAQQAAEIAFLCILSGARP